MFEELLNSWFGKIGFVFLIILLILLLGATMGVIIGSKTRIKRLENRIVELEANEHEFVQLAGQTESIEQFEKRFDRLEASFSRLNDLLKNSKRSSEKIAEKTPSTTENSPPSNPVQKIAKKRYHTVRSGETLYSICQRYGMPMEKIRSLNKLNDVSAIYPGQKLLLSAKSM
ncbi:MAG: LysM peptidoglycan-binding domain-containing protein [Desulfobacterales bacterium]